MEADRDRRLAWQQLPIASLLISQVMRGPMCTRWAWLQCKEYRAIAPTSI